MRGISVSCCLYESLRREHSCPVYVVFTQAFHLQYHCIHFCSPLGVVWYILLTPEKYLWSSLPVSTHCVHLIAYPILLKSDKKSLLHFYFMGTKAGKACFQVRVSVWSLLKDSCWVLSSVSVTCTRLKESTPFSLSRVRFLPQVCEGDIQEGKRYRRKGRKETRRGEGWS